ncbi:MAG: fibronectin type III domain-containing protein [Spirochaetaceae bacterium]|jgi:hypothetical protein|nr:fibronectin type III domain-containing protein [Spirochaetaceae bacterium]
MKRSNKKISFLAALSAMLIVLLYGCLNPADNSLLGEESDRETLELLNSFDFEPAPLIVGTPVVGPGQDAGRFYVPENENAQIVYTLVSGEGAIDNGRFAVAGDTLKIGGEALDWGECYIRVMAMDKNKNTAEKTFTLGATLTPARVARAPVLIPNFIGETPAGENKLTVEWYATIGADSYEVWISTTDNVAEATLQGEYADPVTSAEFDTFPGESDKLPNSTRYWVWVRAENGWGYSDYSPVATRKTFDPVDPWWYEGVESFGFLGMDGYRITPTRLTYFTGIGGLAGYTSDILHHEVFDQEDVDSLMSWSKGGEDLSGLPGGVFIIKLDEAKMSNKGGNYLYYAVYYWGRGYIAGEYIRSYIINPWAGACEQATYAQALETFTIENFERFNANVAAPYTRVMED